MIVLIHRLSLNSISIHSIKPFTVVHDSIVSEVREDLVEEYVKNAKECIQRDRGLTIPDCPIKVDFEVGPSWGELSDYEF